MAFIDTVAERLAVEAFAQAQKNGDDEIIKEVTRILGETSPSLEEVFNTAIRYLRAEQRAQVAIKRSAGKPAES